MADWPLNKVKLALAAWHTLMSPGLFLFLDAAVLFLSIEWLLPSFVINNSIITAFLVSPLYNQSQITESFSVVFDLQLIHGSVRAQGLLLSGLSLSGALNLHLICEDLQTVKSAPFRLYLSLLSALSWHAYSIRQIVTKILCLVYKQGRVSFLCLSPGDKWCFPYLSDSLQICIGIGLHIPSPDSTLSNIQYLGLLVTEDLLKNWISKENLTCSHLILAMKSSEES